MGFDLARIAPVKLLLLDVDGVLTDGGIVIDDSGLESKSFHVRDGLGIRLLIRAGLEVGIITGRTSGVVERRAADLGIEWVFQGVGDKVEAYEKILAELSLTDEQAAFAGDDLVDLPVMRRAGLALAPADAVEEVRRAAHVVSRFPGGRGAVREMVEIILKAQGRWQEVTAPYDG